jgi:hypothetical protein
MFVPVLRPVDDLTIVPSVLSESRYVVSFSAELTGSYTLLVNQQDVMLSADPIFVFTIPGPFAEESSVWLASAQFADLPHLVAYYPRDEFGNPLRVWSGPGLTAAISEDDGIPVTASQGFTQTGDVVYELAWPQTAPTGSYTLELALSGSQVASQGYVLESGAVSASQSSLETEMVNLYAPEEAHTLWIQLRDVYGSDLTSSHTDTRVYTEWSGTGNCSVFLTGTEGSPFLPTSKRYIEDPKREDLTISLPT